MKVGGWGQHFIKYTVRSSFVRTVFQQTHAGTVNEIIKEFVSTWFVRTMFHQSSVGTP